MQHLNERLGDVCARLGMNMSEESAIVVEVSGVRDALQPVKDYLDKIIESYHQKLLVAQTEKNEVREKICQKVNEILESLQDTLLEKKSKYTSANAQVLRVGPP